MVILASILISTVVFFLSDCKQLRKSKVSKPKFRFQSKKKKIIFGDMICDVICDPLCEVQAKVSKSNYEISIKVRFLLSYCKIMKH